MSKQKTKINRQILITIILIALIALIGFNFEKITGGVINHSYPIVSVYKQNFPGQNNIIAGDYITVEIQVGKYPVKLPVYIDCTTGLETLNKDFGITTLRPGYGSGKNENIFIINYKSSDEWKGDCYAKVYFYNKIDEGDRTHKDYLNAYFTVKPKEE